MQWEDESAQRCVYSATKKAFIPEDRKKNRLFTRSVHLFVQCEEHVSIMQHDVITVNDSAEEIR